MRAKLLLVALIAALAVLMGARTAKADGIVSDTLTIYASDGSVVTSISASEDNEDSSLLH